MKNLKEKNIEILIVQEKNEFKVFPPDDSRIKAYKKIFTILKEALQFSGLPLEGINLKYNNNHFNIYEKGGTFYAVLSLREISLDEILEILQEEVIVKEGKEVRKVVVEEKMTETIKEAPPEEDINLSPEIFEKIKEITREYLGTFAETIFENQLRDARINPQNATLRKTKRFILSLQNAASMIIGPSQAKEMKDKIFKLLP